MMMVAMFIGCLFLVAVLGLLSMCLCKLGDYLDVKEQRSGPNE